MTSDELSLVGEFYMGVKTVAERLAATSGSVDFIELYDALCADMVTTNQAFARLTRYVNGHDKEKKEEYGTEDEPPRIA